MIISMMQMHMRCIHVQIKQCIKQRNGESQNIFKNKIKLRKKTSLNKNIKR